MHFPKRMFLVLTRCFVPQSTHIPESTVRYLKGVTHWGVLSFHSEICAEHHADARVPREGQPPGWVGCGISWGSL